MTTLLRLSVAVLVLASALVRGDDQLFDQRVRTMALEHKLKSMVVSINFTQATIGEAVRALADQSKQLDPEHKGVGFVIQPGAAETGKLITLKLDKVPLSEALRYACELGYVGCEIGDRFVTIKSLWGGDSLVQRTFHVDPDFVGVAAKAGVIPTPKGP